MNLSSMSKEGQCDTKKEAMKDQVQEFCVTNGVGVSFHDKTATHGCKEALAERKRVLGEELHEKSELKTILMVTKSGIYVALHMPSNKEFLMPLLMTDYCRFRDMDKFSAINNKLGLTDDDKIVVMAFAVSGTINPISLHLNHGSAVKHFFDASLLLYDGPYYTNAGHKEIGIKIDSIKELMGAMPDSQVKDFTCHMDIGHSR